MRDASTNYRVRKYFKSAGMIDSNENETMKNMTKQMKKIVMDARKTANIQGRATELQYNLANSVLLAVASTPPASREDEEDGDEPFPSRAKILKLLDVPLSSGQQLLKNWRDKDKLLGKVFQVKEIGFLLIVGKDSTEK